MSLGKYFAGAGLLVLPFIFGLTPGEDMRDPKARFLAILFGLWLGTELWRKVHPSLGCAALLAFASAALWSVVFPLHQVLVLIGAFGSCLWVVKLSKDDVKRGLEILEISGVLVAFYAVVLQLGGQDSILTYLPGHRPMAFFGQHTLYGPFAVACFASALFFSRHFRALLLFLPIPIVDSSFTYLSMATVLFFYGLFLIGWRILFAPLLVILVAFGISKIRPETFEDALNDQGRFRLWEHSALLAKNHWAVGHGLASFRLIYPIFQDPALRVANGIDDEKQSAEMRSLFAQAEFIRRQVGGPFMHPHSEPMLVYFEFGAIGLIVGLWWLSGFVWRWLHLPDEAWAWALAAIFFSFIANSLGNFPFHLIPQALLPLWAFVIVTSRGREAILEEDAAYYSR